jgi:hypothetical protein
MILEMAYLAAPVLDKGEFQRRSCSSAKNWTVLHPTFLCPLICSLSRRARTIQRSNRKKGTASLNSLYLPTFRQGLYQLMIDQLTRSALNSQTNDLPRYNYSTTSKLANTLLWKCYLWFLLPTLSNLEKVVAPDSETRNCSFFVWVSIQKLL